MTFLELQDAALQAVGHTTEASSTPRTRIKRHINQWQRRLLTRPGFSRLLRDSEITFNSAASQAVYGLGVPIGRINGIHERTNDWSLERRSLDQLRCIDPGLTSSGSPTSWIMRGWFPVQKHPSDASAIFLKGGDVTDVQSAYWEVIQQGASGPTPFSGTTVLTGTTAVNIDTAVTAATEVTKLTLSFGAIRGVTIHEDSGAGPQLGEIPRGRTHNRYLHVQLWPTPTGVITYRLDYTREIQDLVEDSEISLLPPDYHHILHRGAEFEEWRKLDDTRAEMCRQDLEAEIVTLNHWLWDLAEEESTYPPEHSRLGPWYPAGS